MLLRFVFSWIQRNRRKVNFKVVSKPMASQDKSQWIDSSIWHFVSHQVIKREVAWDVNRFGSISLFIWDSFPVKYVWITSNVGQTFDFLIFFSTWLRKKYSFRSIGTQNWNHGSIGIDVNARIALVDKFYWLTTRDFRSRKYSSRLSYPRKFVRNEPGSTWMTVRHLFYVRQDSWLIPSSDRSHRKINA